jgi:origin recognition complex subunit 1
MVRINFQPYTTPQLEKIVHARLASAQASLGAPEATEVIAPDGVKFAAMKVSSISGDARRVLDICRCAGTRLRPVRPVLTRAARRRAVEEVRPKQRAARLVDVRSVIAVLQNSPTAAYVRECALHERLMLAALLKCARRAGVEEVPWGEVRAVFSAHRC